MTQEYIETVVLDDPLGEARKPLVGEAADALKTQMAEPPVDDYDDAPTDPGNYSWIT